MTSPRGNWTDWLRFRCTGCGNCCRETIVMLTDSDVSRIAEGTGIAPRGFVRFFGESEIAMPSRHPFWIRFAGYRAAMALGWKRDQCKFLGSDDRCTIYDDRPLACREHPFRVSLSDTGGVEDLELSGVAECLYELDGRLTRRQLARVCRWNERESDAYHKRVKAWNRRRTGPRTPAAFMRSLDLDWNSATPKTGHQRIERGEAGEFGRVRGPG